MKLSETLPSKKIQRIIIFTLACVLVGLGIHALVQQYKQRQVQEAAGIEIAYVDLESSQLDERDDDSDGLPNWEEVLWGLDPNNSDSDGDGVSDGEYVQTKKNIQLEKDLGVTESNRATKSQELGRSLYAAILAIEESGGTLDADAQNQISDNVAEYIKSLSVVDDLYFREDLNLVENTQANSFAYRDELGVLLSRYPVEQDDLELIVETIETSEPYRTRISRLANQYRSLVEGLASMDVPYVIAGRHTELINSISHLSQAFQELDQPESDEIFLIASVVQMQEVLFNAADSIIYIETFFEIIEDDSMFNG